MLAGVVVVATARGGDKLQRGDRSDGSVRGYGVSSWGVLSGVHVDGAGGHSTITTIW